MEKNIFFPFLSQFNGTIPVCFIAMRSGLWRMLAQEAKDPLQLMGNFDKSLGLRKRGYTWYHDQLMVTRYINF